MATAIYPQFTPIARRSLSGLFHSLSLLRRTNYYHHYPTTTLQAQQQREVSYSIHCPVQPVSSRTRPSWIPPSAYKARAVRWRSTEAEAKQQTKQEAREATQYVFEDIKTLTTNPSPPPSKKPSRLLIDVREPAEFSRGHIPSALNIPIQSQPDALSLSPEDFEERFDFPKPRTDQEVVFYCLAGVRSQVAARVAEGAGYGNRGEYRGSWEDWVKRGGEVGR